MEILMDELSVTKDDLYLNAFALFAAFAAVAVIFTFAFRMFRGIQVSDTPFTAENVKNIKMMSYTMVVSAILMTISGWILSDVFGPDTSIDATGGFAMLLMAVLFYFMALIFECGTELQKESDSTL
jgi:hypothetical protein